MGTVPKPEFPGASWAAKLARMMSKESSLGPVHSFLHVGALALCDVSRRYVSPMYHLSFAKQRFFKVIKFIYLFLTVSRFWVIVKKVCPTPSFPGYMVVFSNGFIPPTLSLNLSSIWNVSWDMVWGRDPVGTISVFFPSGYPIYLNMTYEKKNPVLGDSAFIMYWICLRGCVYV